MKELEQSLLGTILKAEINDGCNALLNEAKESGINADFFTSHDTRTMWETMCKLDSKGRNPWHDVPVHGYVQGSEGTRC